MATGRRLIINSDRGGFACFRSRDNTERDRCSDRMKGIRRYVTKRSRTALKKELRNLDKD